MTTISQLKELSNEELRVRVATLLGWTKVGPKGFGSNDLVGCKTDPGWPFTPVPRFAESLDAMHEAEKTLSDEEHWKFRSTLWDLTDDPKGLPSDGERHNRDYCQSDARLRAIAFVFVRGT